MRMALTHRTLSNLLPTPYQASLPLQSTYLRQPQLVPRPQQCANTNRADNEPTKKGNQSGKNPLFLPRK